MMPPRSLVDRYYLLQEPDRTWSVCDRQIIEIERDHRIVTSLTADHAVRLMRKLNLAEATPV